MGAFYKEEIQEDRQRTATTAATTGVPASLGTLVLSAVGTAADAGTDFVYRVWTEAIAAVPDATPQEVAFFVGQLWQTFSRKKSIHNPTGIVISSIGSSMKLQIEAHRKAAEAKHEAEARDRMEAIRLWTEIANDTESESEASRGQVREILRSYGVEIE
jgi:hypothetical protein